MDKAKPVDTPLNPSLPLVKAKPGDKRTDIQTYQELTGSLNHCAVFSRPDISFAVSKLSQFNSDPTETHMKAARRVLVYLKGTIYYSIIYGDAIDTEIHAYTRAIHPEDYLSILGFADADHASDKDDRKSQTGYIFLINNASVVWESHKQQSVTLSTRDAEYMAVSDASREAITRIHLYTDLQITTAQPPLLYSDSITALLLTDESAPYQRSKHIDVRYHFIRDIVKKGEIQVDYVPSEENPADIFTKALNSDLHHHCVLGLGLRPIYLQ